eukprot:gene11700-13815_t
MHLDNGQETIPALLADRIREDDLKYSYYREHTHALACGVPAGKVMAELFGRIDGTCKGAGGSMHIFDKETNFQGGWALVSEQLSYATGAARSILLDRTRNPDKHFDDERITVVMIGEGGAQNGRMAEALNAAAKENLPILFLVIDNGRAINTFTPDVAANSDVYKQGQYYEVPGIKIDGQSLVDTLRAGRVVVDYVRTRGPAILQVHTYRFQGHSPADPEHEEGRKAEKRWARANVDPIKLFEAHMHAERASGHEAVSDNDMAACRDRAAGIVKEAVKFAKESPPPPPELAKELEFPHPPDTDYNALPAPAHARAVNERTISSSAMSELQARIEGLHVRAEEGHIQIADAINLAILEEMLRDPSTVIHAEDLKAGSSYDIPKLTQQTFGPLRAADEIIDEGHIIGKALGEALNGYRPIVELMNTNFGIYGMYILNISAGCICINGCVVK